MLTETYKHMLYAFKEYANLRSEEYNGLLSPALIISQYRTMYMGSGLASGKTTALADFAYDWIQNDGKVIILSCPKTWAIVGTKRKIEEKFTNIERKFLVRSRGDNSVILTTSLRTFLSGEWYDIRGRAPEKYLIIIEDMRDFPDNYKIAENMIKYMPRMENLPLVVMAK